jgi:release factor glutamine methyltransferase
VAPMSKTDSASKTVRADRVAVDSGCTVSAIIGELSSRLTSAGLAGGERSACDILSALLDVSRSWPAMNREASVANDIAVRARAAASKLIDGAPFAYAVSSAQFRHLDLFVDERVLIPRPETEVLVDEVLGALSSRFGPGESWGTAVDIGTGSGAIALSLAAEGRFDKVVATDVSRDAIAVAQINACKRAEWLKCPVEFRIGSLVSPIREVRATAVVSNPPYIAFSEIDALPASVRDGEPPLALLAGNDGMSAIAQIIAEGAEILVGGGILALEVDERRASLAAELAMANGAYTEIRVRLDLAGRERFVLASRN